MQPDAVGEDQDYRAEFNGKVGSALRLDGSLVHGFADRPRRLRLAARVDCRIAQVSRPFQQSAPGSGMTLVQGDKLMKKLARIGAVLFGVIVMFPTITLPGCQTGRTYSRNREGNAFEQSSRDGPSCRFG
jgi:hypothetical protein